MKSFSDIRGYLSRAKNTVVESAKSAWGSYFVQGTVEGVMAPVYSYVSVCNMLNESEELSKTVKDASNLNITYALEGISSYFLYEMIHESAENSNSSAGKYGLTTLDYAVFIAMNAFLMRELTRNIIKNGEIRDTMACQAAKVMKESKDFKPAESKMEKVSAIGGSALISLVNQQVKLGSQLLGFCSTGYKTRTAAFLLESVSTGWSLVDYKLNAAEVSNEDRLKKWKESNWYIICYGASCVAASHLTYALLTVGPNVMLGGMGFAAMAFNFYTYYAISSLLFDLYALIAISREKAYPGENQIAVDYWAMLKPYLDTPAMQSLLRAFLQELYSLEDFLNSKETSKWLTTREPDITKLLNYVKDGLDQVDSIQSSRTVGFAKWLNQLVPGLIPSEVEKILKTKNKFLKKLIAEIEQILDEAKIANAKHNAIARNTVKDKQPEQKNEEQKNNVYSRVIIVPSQEQLDQPEEDKNDGVPKIIPMKVEKDSGAVLSESPLRQEEKPQTNLMEITARLTEPVPLVPLIQALENKLIMDMPHIEIKQEEKKPVERKQESSIDLPMRLQESIIHENYFGDERPVRVPVVNDSRTKARPNYSVVENNLSLFRSVPMSPSLRVSDPVAMMAASIITGRKSK